jgi:two-component system, NarL family, nitrate/nitrite response regulator NarL
MNVLLIDDHFCAREGVAGLLKQIFPELIVFEAETFDKGLAIARTMPLNLVLLDVQLPGKDGLAGLAELKAEFPDLCVAMFSALDQRDLIFEALRLGAMGFIVKNVMRQVFIDALQDVLSGKVYLPASVVGQPPPAGPVKLGLLPVSDPASLGLTPREFDVLSRVALGQSNKQIARHLNIENQTVRNHLRPIFLKFGVARRTELLIKLFEQGIVFGKPEVGNQKDE